MNEDYNSNNINANTTNNDLDSLEQSLSNLVEKYQKLKVDHNHLQNDYNTLKQTNHSLLESQSKIELRVKGLLDNLMTVE